MKKYDMTVEGMRCPMCEKHAVEAVETLGKVKKVKASFQDKRVEFKSTELFSEEQLRNVIAQAGYQMTALNVTEVRDGWF